MLQRYDVLGLRVEKYVGDSVDGHNCDFEYTPEVFERYVLLLTGFYGKKYELSLCESEGECGSGWCTASFGHIDLKEVNDFAGWTHKINEKTTIEFDIGDEEIDTEVFSYSDDGGDSYYPHGYVHVNLELFTAFPERIFDKRPVLIFHGESCTLKSHLAALSGKSVLELDSLETADELPYCIIEDIIVIGNRHKFDIDEVKSRIFGDVEIIDVKFTKDI